MSNRLPFSIVTALEQIELEIHDLRTEVSYARKDVQVLQTEKETAVDVVKSQTVDIERYLIKEIGILDEIIKKQHERQLVEFKRLWKVSETVKEIIKELEQSRLETHKMFNRVETTVGLKTDGHEPFPFESILQAVGTPHSLK